MKKKRMIILIALLVLTLAVIAAAIFMLAAVSGDDLLYMNSNMGSVIAACYRWVCLAAAVFTAAWIVVLAVNFKRITAKIKHAASNRSQKKVQPVTAPAPDEVPAHAPVPAASAPKPDHILCPKCSAKLPLGAKFCGKCGTVLANASPKQPSLYCEKCGAELEPGALFCSVCGAKRLP